MPYEVTLLARLFHFHLSSISFSTFPGTGQEVVVPQPFSVFPKPKQPSLSLRSGAYQQHRSCSALCWRRGFSGEVTTTWGRPPAMASSSRTTMAMQPLPSRSLLPSERWHSRPRKHSAGQALGEAREQKCDFGPGRARGNGNPSVESVCPSACESGGTPNPEDGGTSKR